MKRLTFARRLTAALALVMAASTLAVLAPAAHADPSPNLVATGWSRALLYKDADGLGSLRITVTAQDGDTDDIDVTLTYNGVVVASGSGTMKEFPSYFKLDFWLDDGYGGEFHYVGQIYRSSGAGSGKYQEDGTSFWNRWYSLGYD
jgi:hypothetical protein